MTRVLEEYSNALRAITKSQCDEDIIEYMAGMLLEEDIHKLDAEAVSVLIGSFLLDAGPCQTDADVAEACAQLIQLLTKSDTTTTQATTTPATTPATPAAGNGGDARRPFNAQHFLADSDTGFRDPYLGLQEVNVNFNAQMTLTESLKLQAAVQKEREKQARLMREWEKSKAPLPPPVRKHGTVQLEKVTDVIVNSFSVSVAGRDLLKDASLKIVIGRKYGLIGRNGIGKSTFIGALVRHEIPGVSRSLTIGCVEQEISQADLDTPVLEAVLGVDVERTELLVEEARLLAKPQTEEVGQRLAAVYTRMEEIDANAAEAVAASILAGLQFTVPMQQRKVRELSGGWRMRVALARALFSMPDILCLDEPTNHLDLHAVAWLTDYLLNSPTTCIIVSHARDFLNDVCTDVIDFRDQQLKYYRGDFDTYERVKAEAERLQQRQYEAQQLKRAHMQQFIDRFRYKAARAALVQSRIKTLEKLPRLEAVTGDPTLSFHFDTPEELPTPILQLSGAWFMYDTNGAPSTSSDAWVLKNVDLSIDLQSRIAVCGVNGSGKTTLLKLLVGTSEPTKGACRRSNKLRVGFFSQYHVDQLDLTLNSVQQLQTRYREDNIKDEDARAFLGRFGIGGLLALEPLYVLSGGQKSRVAIALMAYKNPHILVLDEPTNHLDLDAVQALIVALNEFEGGVVVVSHDTHLIACVVDELWHVDPKTHAVSQYDGDIASYKKDTLKRRL